MAALKNSSFQPFDSEIKRPDEETLIIFSVLLCALSFVSTVVNLISFILFVKNRELLANPANKLIFNFNISSLAVSIFTMPTAFISFASNGWVFKDFICQVTGIFSICLSAVEMLTLGSMAYDRHNFIVSPLTYPINMTSFKVNVMIFFTWLVAIVSGLMPVFGWGAYGFNNNIATCTVLWPNSSSFSLYYIVVAFALPLLIQIYCYGGIIRAAKRQAKFGRRMSRVAIVPLQVARILRETSASKTIRKTCVVMGIYLTTWLPFMIVIVIQGFRGETGTVTLVFLANILTYLSSLLYPLLFVFRANNLRKEVRTLLRSSLFFTCLNTVMPAEEVESSERKERRKSSLSLDGYDFGSRRRSSKISRVSWAMPVVTEDGIEPSKEPRSSLTASTITTDVSSIQGGTLLPGELDYSSKQTETRKTNRIIKP